jgi:hypothetical protein
MQDIFTAYNPRSHVNYGMYMSESHANRVSASVRLNSTSPEVSEVRTDKDDLQLTQSVYIRLNTGSLPREAILS